MRMEQHPVAKPLSEPLPDRTNRLTLAQRNNKSLVGMEDEFFLTDVEVVLFIRWVRDNNINRHTKRFFREESDIN